MALLVTIAENIAVAIPCVLVVALATMAIHRQMTETKEDEPIADFLVSTLVQVAPLFALKARLIRSVNRLVLLSRTASKILFMHISVLTLRLTLVPMLLKKGFGGYDSPLEIKVNLLALVSAVYIMSVVCEFRWTIVEFLTHSDIGILHVLGMVHCGVLMLLRNEDVRLLQDWAAQYTNSMEMLAYMPAVWNLLITDEKLLAFEPLSQGTTQNQAIWFLLWMMAYNGYEDFVTMMESGVYEVHFVSAHVAHFLLMLDFSLFLLHQAYNTKVAKNENSSSCEQLQDVANGK